MPEMSINQIPATPNLAPVINYGQLFNPNVKDSRWLTLEVCREYTRQKCTRTENECKFAHPPPHVEVQNGRVTCCFDSIKGKCQRKEPPCKYLHPPQHLREQLLQNGRNNLILRQLQAQAMVTGTLGIPPYFLPTTYEASQLGTTTTKVPYPSNQQVLSATQYPVMPPFTMLQNPNPAFSTNPYHLSPTAGLPGLVQTVDGCGAANAGTVPTSLAGIMATQTAAAATHTPQKMARPDRVEANGSTGNEGNYPTVVSSVDLAPSSQYAGLYSLQRPLVEVLAPSVGVKRPRDPADDLLLQTPSGIPAGMVPMVKRPAMDKTGVPMFQHQQQAAQATAYQPTMAAMQQYVPVTPEYAVSPPESPARVFSGVQNSSLALQTNSKIEMCKNLSNVPDKSQALIICDANASTDQNSYVSGDNVRVVCPTASPTSLFLHDHTESNQGYNNSIVNDNQLYQSMLNDASAFGYGINSTNATFRSPGGLTRVPPSPLVGATPPLSPLVGATPHVFQHAPSLIRPRTPFNSPLRTGIGPRLRMPASSAFGSPTFHNTLLQLGYPNMAGSSVLDSPLSSGEPALNSPSCTGTSIQGSPLWQQSSLFGSPHSSLGSQDSSTSMVPKSREGWRGSYDPQMNEITYSGVVNDENPIPHLLGSLDRQGDMRGVDGRFIGYSETPTNPQAGLHPQNDNHYKSAMKSLAIPLCQDFRTGNTHPYCKFVHNIQDSIKLKVNEGANTIHASYTLKGQCEQAQSPKNNNTIVTVPTYRKIA